MSYLSPSVNIKEYDYSGIVPTVQTTSAAIAGKFNAGPLNTPVLISSEDSLYQTFGAPDNNNYMEWFCAAEFLKYSSSLYVTRATPAGILNATWSGTGYLIDSADTFYNLTAPNKTSIGYFAAKNPGLAGNNIGIIIVDAGGWTNFKTWAATLSTVMPNKVTFDQYVSQPGTTSYVSKFAVNPTEAKNDEVAIIVYDATGVITGKRYTVLEKYSGLSKATDAVDYTGAPIYAPAKINTASAYIWMVSFPTAQITRTATITGATVTSNVATITTGAAHAFNVGDTVTISAVTSSGPGSYDGTFTIVSVPTATSFTVANTTTPGTYTSGGSVTDTIPASDVDANTGFTAAQVSAIGVDFTPFAYTSINSTYTLEMQLAGGVAGTLATDAQIQTAYSVYASKDNIDIGHVITAGFDTSIIQYCVQQLASGRGDCMAYMSVYNTTPGTPIRDTDITPEQEAITCKNSWNLADQDAQYSMTDTGYKYIYDKYNNIYRWIPLNGDTAGIAARLGAIAEEFYSPGGFNRGGYRNVIKLAFNPTQAQRDVIYPLGINPVVHFNNEGVILYGDRTGTVKPSAFDRYNVRRLFIILEKAISKAAKYQLFEFNDAITQAQFRNMVEPFLRNIQGKRGITDFMVRCDQSNNTAQVVDSNQFVGEVYIKPAYSINEITLTFVATRSDVSFTTTIA